MLDPDTFTSPESHEIALLAAGAAIDAARHALATRASRRSRWCGRRATTPSPIARWASACSTTSPIAAAALRADGVARVAIVDIDVHHGNGTQAAFYDDPTVLFVSSHQYPYYPGTGAADETGAGAGRGLHAEHAAGGRRDRRRLSRARTTQSSCRRSSAFAPDAAPRLRRLRRARARSAGRHADDDGRATRGSSRCSTTRPRRLCGGRIALRHRGRLPPRRAARVPGGHNRAC